MSVQDINPWQKIDTAPLLSKRQKNQIQWLLICLMVLGYAAATLAQNGLNDLNYQAQSEFQPTIKDAIKFSDLPEIKDTVKRIDNIRYGITSRPLFPKYQVQPIEAAKLQNEPLPRLYHSLLKLGYGPVYNMPYGEFWISSTRSRNSVYGAHLKHFSSDAHLKDVGYSGFSDNLVNVFGKQFYKKHTLSGDFNYERNVIYYYGYDPAINSLDDKKYTRQRYQFFNPKIQLQSHYTDSSHINHNIQLGYYNLQNIYKETENNIRLNAAGSMFVNKEKVNLNFLTDFYNHKQSNDTINDLIMSLNPSVEGNSQRGHIDVGFTGTYDNFGKASSFYFYPQINLHYNIYDNMIIPYAGVGGSLIKNSFRKLSQENPFVDTTLNYKNTSDHTGFIGLRGHLSSSTAYDAKVSYSQYSNLYFYAINYSGLNQVYNRFEMLYDDASLWNVNGQLTHQVNEKFNLIAKANYYYYKTKTLVHAYHKPDYDLTFSGIYNLRSKFIFRADLFFMGKQWALSQAEDNTGAFIPVQKQLNGYADLNLEAEYRYSKMLSFFIRFNNIANQRYYRWERYPSQRFNFMFGLSFVPF